MSGTNISLFGIWGSGPADIYAVGGNGSPTDRIILHSTGDGNWVPQAIPDGFYGRPIRLWGSGPHDVYIVGDQDSTAILHSTGDGTWVSQATGAMQGDQSNQVTGLIGLWGSGSGDVYAAGLGGYGPAGTNTVFRTTGDGTWTPETAGPRGTLFGIWGSGPGDVYAVGVYAVGESPHDGPGTILHSTGGGAWVPQTIGTTAGLHAVWGSGAGDVYAVGQQGTILHHP
jgi:hypothetical protein